MDITYTVEIPNNNTEEVKVAHGWDAKLAGSDNSPHFGIDNPLKPIVGMRNATNGFQAFIFKSGTMWSGYYGAFAGNLNAFLGTDNGNFMEYNTKTISEPEVDSSMAISINFGSTPGTKSTTNTLSFQCNSPSTAPTSAMITPTPTTSTTTTSTYTLGCLESEKTLTIPQSSFPTIDSDSNGIRDIEMIFFNTTTKVLYKATYENTTVVLPPGTYTTYFSDSINGCISPARTVVISKTECPSDLQITKVINANNNIIKSGNTYTITYTATNFGPSDNTSVSVTDFLPIGFTLVGTNPATGTTYNNGVWTVGQLLNGQTKTLTLTVTANDYGLYSSTARISGLNTDGNISNNTSSTALALDSDNDGITDNVDKDRDNDGILDIDEKIACDSNSILSLTGYRAVVYDNTVSPNSDLINSWAEINASSTFPTASYSQIATFDYYEFEKKSNAFDILFSSANVLNLGFTAENSSKIKNFVGTGIKSSTGNNDYAIMFTKTITIDDEGTY